MTENTSVQTQETAGIRALLRTTEQRWAPFVPRGVSVEAVVQSAYLETKKNPALLQCQPESIVQTITRILQLGLDVGTTGFLVPFGKQDKKCQMVIAKDGIVQLIIGTGVVRHLEARCVYAKEPYRFLTGTQTIVEHRPIFDPDERGPMIGAYAVFHMRGGDVQAFEMSAKEIDGIRQKFSQQWKAGPLQDWYAEKTVIIHGAKHLPKNPKLARIASALGLSDEGIEDEAPASAPGPVQATSRVVGERFGVSSAEVSTDSAVETADRGVTSRTVPPDPDIAKPAPPVATSGTEPYGEPRRKTAHPVSPAAVEEAKRTLAEHGTDGYAGTGRDDRPIEQVLAELPFQDDRDLEP